MPMWPPIMQINNVHAYIIGGHIDIVDGAVCTCQHIRNRIVVDKVIPAATLSNSSWKLLGSLPANPN